MAKPPTPPSKLDALVGTRVHLVTPLRDWDGVLELDSGEYQILNERTRIYFTEDEVRAVDVDRVTIYLKYV